METMCAVLNHPKALLSGPVNDGYRVRVRASIGVLYKNCLDGAGVPPCHQSSPCGLVMLHLGIVCLGADICILRDGFKEGHGQWNNNTGVTGHEYPILRTDTSRPEQSKQGNTAFVEIESVFSFHQHAINQIGFYMTNGRLARSAFHKRPWNLAFATQHPFVDPRTTLWGPVQKSQRSREVPIPGSPVLGDDTVTSERSHLLTC